MKTLLLIISAVVLLPSLCWGWGREGHQIIARIAEDHLNQTTKAMIQSLIGSDHLDSVGTWAADQIRNEYKATKPWHYVNIPFGSTYDANRDCPRPKSCVVEKIKEFTNVLTNKKACCEDRVAALKFVVHLVADIHQPMQAAREAEGGQGVHVRFLDSDHCGPYECNLHEVWDTSLIRHAGLKPDAYAERLEQLITAEHLARQDGGTPEDWANESLALAKAAWVRDGAVLGERYYQREIKVVDRQMALAGLRLARLLNDTIGKLTPGDFR